MSGESVVTRYFAALDAADTEVIPELFCEDCRIVRPELPEPLVGPDAVKGVVTIAHRIYERFETRILDVLDGGELVSVRVRHDVVCRGAWRTRLGTFDVPGRDLSWEAMALFRLRDGRISEERVFRDELGMLLRLGVLETPR